MFFTFAYPSQNSLVYLHTSTEMGVVCFVVERSGAVGERGEISGSRMISSPLRMLDKFVHSSLLQFSFRLLITTWLSVSQRTRNCVWLDVATKG